MTFLTGFGLLAVTTMLVMYILEQRHYWFRLGFASACILAAVYGFAQGAWPFGLVEIVWAMAAAWEWHKHYCRRHGLNLWWKYED